MMGHDSQIFPYVLKLMFLHNDLIDFAQNTTGRDLSFYATWSWSYDEFISRDVDFGILHSL